MTHTYGHTHTHTKTATRQVCVDSRLAVKVCLQARDDARLFICVFLRRAAPLVPSASGVSQEGIFTALLCSDLQQTFFVLELFSLAMNRADVFLWNTARPCSPLANLEPQIWNHSVGLCCGLSATLDLTLLRLVLCVLQKPVGQFRPSPPAV